MAKDDDPEFFHDSNKTDREREEFAKRQREREATKPKAKANGAGGHGDDPQPQTQQKPRGLQTLSIGSDVEIAYRVVQDMQNRFGEIVFAEGEFYRYVKTHWEPIEEADARIIVHAYDGAYYAKNKQVKLTKGHINSVLNEAGAVLAQPDFFSRSAVGINCANGFITFNSHDGKPQIGPHDPQHRCRHVLPGSWKPGFTGVSPNSLLEKLLNGTFRGDADAQDKVLLIGEMAGAAATGHATKLSQPKSQVLVGEGAENGKSQILDILRGVLPTSAITSVTAAKMGDEKYLIRLRGKLLNAADELSGSAAIASEAFKAVVTGNTVTGRDLYRSGVDFCAVALNVFATNALPTFSGGMDRGVRRRVLVLQFNRVIPKEERIEDLGRKIAKEEPDLLLAFAVEGAARLIAARYFTVPPSSAEATPQWFLLADPVLAWAAARVRDWTDLDREQDAPRYKSSAAYERFNDWALNNGYRKDTLPAVNGFVQRLVGCSAAFKKHTATGNWVRGIRILDADEPEERPAL
jgi:P4 family phage/plasmid primase-like protien